MTMNSNDPDRTQSLHEPDDWLTYHQVVALLLETGAIEGAIQRRQVYALGAKQGWRVMRRLGDRRGTWLYWRADVEQTPVVVGVLVRAPEPMNLDEWLTQGEVARRLYEIGAAAGIVSRQRVWQLGKLYGWKRRAGKGRRATLYWRADVEAMPAADARLHRPRAAMDWRWRRRQEQGRG